MNKHITISIRIVEPSERGMGEILKETENYLGYLEHLKPMADLSIDYLQSKFLK